MPIDLGMHSSTGISVFAYQNLRQHLGLSSDKVEIMDGVQLTARVDTDVHERFHCDCILLKPRAAKYRTWNPRGKYTFITPENYKPEMNEQGEWIVRRDDLQMRMPVGGYFFDGHWLAMEDAWEDSFFMETVSEAERIYKETDYFTAFRGFSPFVRCDIDGFCEMIIEPERVMEQNAVDLRWWLEKAAMFVTHMKDYVGAVCMSGDLGSQHSPMVKPEVFEKVSAPYLKEFCDFIHRNSDYKVFLHSCGSIEPLLPILIYCGIDIINPVQISAQNMEPEMLKNKYGKDIVFWGGGVDTQNVLGVKSLEAISENVKYLVDTFKPGGGYVFCPNHNIMGNVPPDNIITAYDTAYKNSFY